MNFIRIGDKLIDKDRIDAKISEILQLRARGASQQEVADKLGLDRSFVSRLENVGEVRRGGKIALIGFPIGNKDEVYDMARQEGVEFVLVLNDKERWEFVRNRSGIELFNDIVQLVSRVREFDTVVLLGSDKRVRFMAGLLDNETIQIPIGVSPIEGDVYVNVEELRKTIRELLR